MEEAAALSDSNSNSDEILLIDLRSPETNMQIKFEILNENSSGCNSNGYVNTVCDVFEGCLKNIISDVFQIQKYIDRNKFKEDI